MTISIDPRISDHFRQLNDSEFRALEQSCIDEGIRDAIIVWKEEQCVIDGNNRFAIANKHGLPYKTEEKSFSNLSDVFAWMDQNQCGRRNLDKADAVQLYRRWIEDHPDATTLEMSEAIGVDSRQVRRIKEADSAINELFPSDLADRIRDGSLVAPNKSILRFKALDAKRRNSVIEKLRSDPTITLQKALPDSKSLSKAPRLNESHQKIVRESLSPKVQQSVAAGAIEATPDSVRRLGQLKPVKRQLVDDILATGGAISVKEAIEEVSIGSKRKPVAAFDAEKLHKAIDDLLGKLAGKVDDLARGLSKSGSDDHNSMIDNLQSIRDTWESWRLAN